MCTRHQRSLVGQQWFQVLRGEDWGGRGVGRSGGRCWPPFDCVILQFRKAYPWGDVGFVVERGDDDVRTDRKVEDEGQIGEELSC